MPVKPSMRTTNKQEFIDFAMASEALAFGEYRLKSGRHSPYFFNTGAFNKGADLYRLCRFYATAIRAAGLEFNQIFGPAYKGIPLACNLVAVLDNEFEQRVAFSCNRKEEKKHGDSGVFMGAKPEGKVLIVDDVLTAGTSIKSSISMLRAAGADPVAAVVALDRCEPGEQQAAAAEIRAMGLELISIIDVSDMLAWLASKPEFAKEHGAMLGHLQSAQAGNQGQKNDIQ